MNNIIVKKAVLVLALILCAAGGWYFLYWSRTPAYAAGEIQQALKKKDLQLFKERVDMDRVYGSAVDDTAAYLASDGRVDHALAASILKMLKKQAEKAKLIVTRDGTVLDRKEYAQFVPKLQK